MKSSMGIMPGSRALRLAARAAGLTASIFFATHAHAQTTAPVAQPGVSPAPAKKPTAILLGERPRWLPEGKQPTIGEILTSSSQILGRRAIDSTTAEEKIATTAERAREMDVAGTDLIVLFTGRADTKSKTGEQEIFDAVAASAAVLTEKGVSLVVVPSSTDVSGSFGGTLRVAANLANVPYVEPGTEFRGTPYEEALQEIAQMLPPGDSPANRPALATPANFARSASAPTTHSAGPAETPIIIPMQPPPAIKHYDPREDRPKPAKKTRNSKQPAVER